MSSYWFYLYLPLIKQIEQIFSVMNENLKIFKKT